MRLMRIAQQIAVALASVGMLTSPLAQAARGATGPTPAALLTSIQDVALQPGGTLFGQISDVQGAPQGALRVTVFRDGAPVADLLTDSTGQFAIRELPAGIYYVQTPVSEGVYRAWSPGTAPPFAQQGVLVVAGPQLVRGQMGGFLGNPYVLALIVAAAIAIPLAVDSDDAS